MLKVNVTQEHIDKGERYNTGGCPIAWALRDALPEGCCGINVHVRVAVWFDDAQVYHQAWLPRPAQDFVVEFDNGYDISPFSFELDADV